jgi:hypothetical protein
VSPAVAVTAVVLMAIAALALTFALTRHSGSGSSDQLIGKAQSHSSSSPRPSGHITTNAPAVPQAKAAATSPSTRPKSPAPPITYVVKVGDNLTIIAAWFHLHGYGTLYEQNKAVIGDDPDLIYAGQRITISNGGMTVG